MSNNQDTGTPSAALTGKLASAAAVAGPFQSDITDTISNRKQHGRTIPKLIGILAKPSPPSIAYAQFTKKACEQVGINFEIWQTWATDEDHQGDTSMQKEEEVKRPDTDLEADVEDLIIAANADDSIHGIMVCFFCALRDVPHLIFIRSIIPSSADDKIHTFNKSSIPAKTWKVSTSATASICITIFAGSIL